MYIYIFTRNGIDRTSRGLASEQGYTAMMLCEQRNLYNNTIIIIIIMSIVRTIIILSYYYVRRSNKLIFFFFFYYLCIYKLIGIID